MKIFQQKILLKQLKTSDSANSAILPKYITATLSEICLTIDKSCAINKYVNPTSFCNLIKRLATCACIDTSKADIGSSQRINLASTANALAIPILCLCPPEDS